MFDQCDKIWAILCSMLHFPSFLLLHTNFSVYEFVERLSLYTFSLTYIAASSKRLACLETADAASAQVRKKNTRGPKFNSAGADHAYFWSGTNLLDRWKLERRSPHMTNSWVCYICIIPLYITEGCNIWDGAFFYLYTCTCNTTLHYRRL